MRHESRVIDGHVVRVPNLDPEPAVTDPATTELEHAITEAEDGLLHALFDPERDTMNDTSPNVEPHNDNRPDSGNDGEAANDEPPDTDDGPEGSTGARVPPEGDTIVTTNTAQAAVARIVELRRWGVSLRVICAVLTAEGYLTARHGRWHAWQVLRVLRRELGPEVTARYGQRAGRPHKDGRPARHRREYVTVPPELRELADELDRLPQGTVVAGVDVSGLPLDDALDTLRAEVPVELDPPRDWPPTPAEELVDELRGMTRDDVIDLVRLLRENLDI